MRVQRATLNTQKVNIANGEKVANENYKVTKEKDFQVSKTARFMMRVGAALFVVIVIFVFAILWRSEPTVDAQMIADAKSAANCEQIFFNGKKSYAPMDKISGPHLAEINGCKFEVGKGSSLSIVADKDSYTITVSNAQVGGKLNPLILKSDGVCKWQGGIGPDC